MDLPKILHLKTCSRAFRSASDTSRAGLATGFTLIEVMLVMAIMTALLVLGLPRLNRGNNNVKKVIRELGVLGKEIRNQARLKNQTYRLAFRMGKDSTYWVEAAQGSVTAKKTPDNLNGLNEDEKKELAAKSPFKKSEKFFKKDEKHLPSGLTIKKVETLSAPESKTEGISYIYFTPEGLVEKSIVQIGNAETLTWTLIYNPLTGHADIVEKAITLKEIQNQ